MATTLLSTLLPDVVAPRCPEPVQLQALRLACRRFCNDTEIWAEKMTSIPSVADQADYTLTPGYDNVIIRRVRGVTADGASLLESCWSVSYQGVLTLDPAPTAAGIGVIPTVVYVPNPQCTAVVDWLVARWGDAIAAGAESQLKRDPGKSADPVPWYDQGGFAVAESRYQTGVSEALTEVFSSRQSGHQGVELRSFYL